MQLFCQKPRGPSPHVQQYHRLSPYFFVGSRTSTPQNEEISSSSAPFSSFAVPEISGSSSAADRRDQRYVMGHALLNGCKQIQGARLMALPTTSPSRPLSISSSLDSCNLGNETLIIRMTPEPAYSFRQTVQATYRVSLPQLYQTHSVAYQESLCPRAI